MSDKNSLVARLTMRVAELERLLNTYKRDFERVVRQRNEAQLRVARLRRQIYKLTLN